MTPEEQLILAQPTWMTAVPQDKPVVRSPDYPLAPVLQKKPPILSTESINLGLAGSGQNSGTLLAIVPVNGLPFYATVTGNLGSQVTT